MATYQVSVSKDYTVFCAGHFVTYDGDHCEMLHGHNYRAAVRLAGALNDDQMVFDFVTLKRRLRTICDQLDHRMLLPQNNPLLQMSIDAVSVTVRYKQKTYVFPREDVVLLPILNTTAELLAWWIATQLEADIRAQAGMVEHLEVEVEETFGQSATCRLKLGAL
jgi:6-pyruvoyltetrahydropterin/6-carboxytetrahydropterin synthase